MGAFICGKCDNMRDSHDGCFENDTYGLICEDCQMEIDEENEE